MAARPNNAFLRALTSAAFEAIEAHLTPVDLGPGAELFRPEEKVQSVYFPLTGLLSLIATSMAGHSVETTMAGCEGAAGLFEACGSGVSAIRCVVQVDGSAVRAPASICGNLARSNSDFSSTAWRLAELQLAESRQSALCQAFHSVEQRFARWMLESAERAAGRNPLPMTQEFLAAMLGVQRTTVTVFAQQLQKTGTLRYTRGRIDILDAEALESRSCECRAIMRDQRHRLGFPAFVAV